MRQIFPFSFHKNISKFALNSEEWFFSFIIQRSRKCNKQRIFNLLFICIRGERSEILHSMTRLGRVRIATTLTWDSRRKLLFLAFLHTKKYRKIWRVTKSENSQKWCVIFIFSRVKTFKLFFTIWTHFYLCRFSFS